MHVSLYRKLQERLRDAAEEVSSRGLKEAAVALILREAGEQLELLLIKRAISERDHWSGHLALPGGRRQAEDANLLMTAMRETREEVGLDLTAGGRTLGRLESVWPRSPLAPQLTVTPYIFVAPAIYHSPSREEAAPALQLNSEVAAAFWLPLSFLRETGRSAFFEMMLEGETQRWPAYPSREGLIWGLTERILTEFLSLLDEL